MHLKELVRILILFLVCLLSLGGAQAQLIKTPSFIDNTIVNSPASLGLFQQEGIYINMFSYNTNFNFNTLIDGVTLVPAYVNLNRILSVASTPKNRTNIRRFNSISYHKTGNLPNDYKVTFGIHIQTTNLSLARISSPNTYGTTTNLHIPLQSSSRKERCFSAGFQMHLIHQKPNKTATAYTYENLIGVPNLDYDSFHNQFSKIGFGFTANVSYIAHKPRKSIIAYGASLGTIESKTASLFQTAGSYIFDSEVNYNGHLFFNGQFTENRKFMLDINILANDNELAGALGIGIKLKNHKILRLALVTFSSEFGFTVTFDVSRFSYTFNVSDFDSSTSPFINSGHFFQLGANYKMDADYKPSLLNLKY